MSRKYNRDQKESGLIKTIRLILTGVTIALLYNWIANEGYYGLTTSQIVTTVYVIGITTGFWLHKLLD